MMEVWWWWCGGDAGDSDAGGGGGGGDAGVGVGLPTGLCSSGCSLWSHCVMMKHVCRCSDHGPV